MRRLRSVTFWILLVMCSAACDYDVHIQAPTAPSTTTPATPTSGTVVEFRVDGETGGAIIRMSNGLDGLTQTTTVLPYSTTVDLGPARTNVFLSLEARGTSFGYLHAAIFVNGILFREGSASSLSPVITINGTYRR